MKILLVGEYSRLHNSLKEGLVSLGHEVKLIGFQDGFKGYPTDVVFYKKWDQGILKKIKVLLYHLTGYDITSYLTFRQFEKVKHLFTNYDVVQLINENSFFCTPKFEKQLIQYLLYNNKKTFLLSCGDDYVFVKHNFKFPNSKSIVQPYLDGKIRDKDFSNVLKFRTKPFKKLHRFLYKNVDGVIASDLDYHIPLMHHPRHKGLIPNPINVDILEYKPLVVEDKIIIFHGINRESYYKKGNDYFEKAVEIIKKKYANSVEIITAENVPYQQYINLYNQAHIVLDQCYAHDQGYNALEAMAKGKVVFTGAEVEFYENYKLKSPVAINAIANVEYLVTELSKLIDEPTLLSTISKNAIDFIKTHHHYKLVAQKYMDVWTRK